MLNPQKIAEIIDENRLDLKLPSSVVPLLGQKGIRLRSAEVMCSPYGGTRRELSDEVEDALDADILEEWQLTRIGLTDIIIRAQRQSDRSCVWVAIEASSRINRHDIERARQSADALATVFRENAIAVVAGYAIDPEESRQAEDTGVEVLIVAR